MLRRSLRPCASWVSERPRSRTRLCSELREDDFASIQILQCNLCVKRVELLEL